MTQFAMILNISTRLLVVWASVAGLFFVGLTTVPLALGADSQPEIPGELPAKVGFNRHIRPILSSNCFQCHGPDEKNRQAELRLDEEVGLRKAFRAGDLAGSEGWQRIHSQDELTQMPPPEAKKTLKPRQIALIRRWIEQGAAYEGHWAFIPPRKPTVPQLDDRWVQNPIDAFVLARLRQAGLQPGQPADRQRLLRRVTLDLTGLPPTLEEIEAFLADSSPDAYEKVVDRLLANPHFGERMALAWMDAARYGDTSVFHADGPRDMWPWRDWVIKAYNDNKPFDEFTIEQLGGDLLAQATLDQKIATGFHRNNATTDEGGVIAEEFRVEYAVDRVKTTSMVWLGLTMECSQCHDHKYDPISQRDYYQFYAFFNQAADPGMQTRRGNQAPTVNVPNSELLKKAESLKRELAAKNEQLRRRRQAIEKPFAQWLAQAEARSGDLATLPANFVLHLELNEGQGKTVADAADPKKTGKIQGKPSWVAGKLDQALQLDGRNFVDLGDVGNFERTDSLSYGAWIKPKGGGNGAPIARMDDRNGYRGYDLYIAQGQVAVHIINSWPNNAIKVTTKAKLKPNTWTHVFATYDGSSKAAGVKIYFNGQEQEWAIEQNGLSATIRTPKSLYLGRRNPGSPYKGLIDDVRIYPRALTAAEVAALAGNDPVKEILATPAGQRTDKQQRILRNHYLQNHDPQYQRLSSQVTQIQAQIAAAEKPISSVMVMQDVPKGRMTYMLERGQYNAPKKDKPVQPGVPAVLGSLPAGAPKNRLGLARWLVQPEHPLTARVAVNRYWKMLFGEGLVRTVGDFGSQGTPPTHPELLDWLATDFVEHGWDIKRTLKQMVMSAAYQQSSQVTQDLLQQDPENHLLARGPRFRLQGEFIRDQALAASGLLVRRIGGPGVKPYQPPGLWNEVSLSGNVRFQQDHGEKLYRRSLYTYWKRSAPAPSMTIFDAPTREKCTLKRSRTNTPLQALVVLNDPQFVEASRALAQRAMLQGGESPEDQITYAYRLVTGVWPKAHVLKILTQGYQQERQTFEQDLQRAKKLLSVGESPRNEQLQPADHAAMTAVMSIIFNLDESLTRG